MGSSWIDSNISQRRSEDSTLTAIQALLNFCKKMNIVVNESNLVETTTDDVTVITGADFASSDIKVTRKFYRTASSAEMSFDLIVPMKNNYYNAFVGLADGRVLAVKDWAIVDFWGSQAATRKLNKRSELSEEPAASPSAVAGSYSYDVIQFPNSDGYDGRTLVTNPADIAASPLGWHNTGSGDKVSSINIRIP